MEPATGGSPPERPGRPVAVPGSDTGLMRTWLGRQGWPAVAFVVLFIVLTGSS